MSRNIAPIRAAVNEHPDSLSAWSAKDAKWDDRRGEAMDVENLYGKHEDFEKLAGRMAKCSGVLSFRQLIDTDTGEIALKLGNASFCHVRHCPVCQWRRGLRNIARFHEALPTIQAAHPKAAWLFLTLTVRNPEMADLRASLAAMNQAWQRLIQRADWPGLGFVRTTEVTRGKDGKPHPHFHALVMVKPSYFKKAYLSQAAWTEHWQSALRADYVPVVHVQRVKATSEKAKAAEAAGDSQAALGAAVAETLKYAVKPADLIADAAFLYGITKQLHKSRFLATGGLLKDVMKETATDAEMVETGSAEEVEKGEEAPELAPMLFGWRPEKRQYRRLKNQKNGGHSMI